ncbi:hypothetical protein BGP_5381 [Beggiatoa sp. PS]|nr:hypothetical protein BGP_5381 [Beggiatoa sp. PS]
MLIMETVNGTILNVTTVKKVNSHCMFPSFPTEIFHILESFKEFLIHNFLSLQSINRKIINRQNENRIQRIDFIPG